jgi:transcriptional regulator with XRE-family HTH domain
MRAKRHELGLTQPEFGALVAEAAGWDVPVHPSTISNYEHDKWPASPRMQVAIAKALGVPLDVVSEPLDVAA